MRLIRSLFLSLSFLVNGLYKIADIEVFDTYGQDERFYLCDAGGIEVDDLVDSVGDAGEAIGELLKEFRLGDVLEARSPCRRCVGFSVLCVFVFACNAIYPDVGKGFIEASSGMLMSSRLNALMMKLLSMSEAFVFRAMMVKFTDR